MIPASGPRLLTDERFDYPGFGGAPSFCRVRIYEHAAKSPVVVATELWENPGTSVTNCVQTLAAAVVAHYLPRDVDRPITWVEHYHFDRPRHEAHDTWDLVTFASYVQEREPHWRGNVYRLGDPTWRRLTEAQVRSLCGEVPR